MVANKKDWLIFEIMHMIMISGKIPLHSIYSIWCKRDLNIEEFMKLWKKPEKNQPLIKLASMTCSSQGWNFAGFFGYLVTYSFLCKDFMLCSRLVGHDMLFDERKECCYLVFKILLDLFWF